MTPCLHKKVPYYSIPWGECEVFYCACCSVIYLAVDIEAVRFFVPLRKVK